MKKLINVRGCNGAGKTTVLRCLARDPGCVVDHVTVNHVLRGEECTHAPIPVTFTPDGIALLGDYTRNAKGTTAGCDKIKTQGAIKNALHQLALDPRAEVILFEGVVVATIFKPWWDFSDDWDGGMTWAFLDTPLEVCLARIQERNGGKPIKEDQVADKHRTIARVREKALVVGEVVADLHWQTALRDLKDLIARERSAP